MRCDLCFVTILKSCKIKRDNMYLTNLTITCCLSKFITYETNTSRSMYNFTYRDSIALRISCIYIRGHRILVPEVSWIVPWRFRPRKELQVGRGKEDQIFGHCEVSSRQVDYCVTCDEDDPALACPTKSVVITSFDHPPSK